MPPRPLFVANWKMNGLHADGIARASALAAHAATGTCGGDIVVCPPATLLFALRAVFSGSEIALGGQDCHAAAEGAHTGDVGAPMLADGGCTHVIVGHSERRASHGEDDETVAAKAAAAHAAELAAVVCVGESAAERNAGRALAVSRPPVEGSLPARHPKHRDRYEPVWAIGSGRTPGPVDYRAAPRRCVPAGSGRYSESALAAPRAICGSLTARNAGEDPPGGGYGVWSRINFLLRVLADLPVRALSPCGG